MALDVEDPGADAILRAISFSPWGAVRVWVVMSTRRSLSDLLTRLVALWSETNAVAREWVTSIQQLVAILQRRAGVGDPYRAPPVPTYNRRPRTNPQSPLPGEDEE